jgi:hypothetical protein
MSDDTPKDWDRLTPEQKYRVERYIQTLLAEQPALPLFQKAGRQVVEQRQAKGVSYQLERIKCGKKNCKCAAGEFHGPYWYAYWREGGKVKSRYIGKQLKPIAPPATGTNDRLPNL